MRHIASRFIAAFRPTASAPALVLLALCLLAAGPGVPGRAAAAEGNGASATVTGGAGADPRYIVQVGAFLSRENAERLSAKLAAKGYTAEVMGLRHRDKDWHAVLVGSFPEAAPAFELARAYREGEKSAAVVARVSDGRYLEDVVEPPAPLERAKEPTQPYRAYLEESGGKAPAAGSAQAPAPAAKPAPAPAAPARTAPAPAKAAEKPAPVVAELENPDVRYVVQIGVFFLYTEAKGLESRYKEGWKARIADYYEGSALWHVVQIGSFADRNEAASRAQAFMEKELRAATVKAVIGNRYVR